MLTEICQELKNWFDVDRLFGTFSITNGSINVPQILDGQYFRIVGSIFNDGVHNSSDTLVDEEFDGAVWLLAIPKAILDLNSDIESWTEKYGDQILSPYNSESFADYSYSKSGAGGGSTAPTWRSVFRDRLNRWRKL